jgi:pyruvate dehydrogenase E1 component
VALEEQRAYPGDLDLERRLSAILRWNALAMVVRGHGAHGELGGHIACYASAGDLFEIGFRHFFHARSATHGGDVVFGRSDSRAALRAHFEVEAHVIVQANLQAANEVQCREETHPICVLTRPGSKDVTPRSSSASSRLLEMATGWV